MSIEVFDPAEQHLYALVAGLVDCAIRGKQLADEMAKAQLEYNNTIAEQIGIDREIDNYLGAHCEDPGHRQYIKRRIWETIQAAVYPEQLPAGAEVPSAGPNLRLVQGEG